MEFIKDFLFDRELNKALNNRQKSSLESSVNPTKSVVILHSFADDKDLEIMDEIVVDWTRKGKSMRTLRFQNDKKENEDPDIYTQADLNWYGFPKSPKVQSFLDEEFDLLIQWNRNNKKHLKALCVLSKAKFKIGLIDQNVEFFDLILDSDHGDDLKSVFRELEKTVTKLSNYEEPSEL